MLKSRRGLLAAGLALAVVGALGVASTLNAGAEQITGASDEQPAAGPAAAVGLNSTPPALLPWGERPERVRKGRAGASSRSLRAGGYDAAANDTSGSTQPRGRYAPKGRWSKNTYLQKELTNIAPPEPPSESAEPTTDATSEPEDTTATTEPTEAAPTEAAPEETTAPEETATSESVPEQPTPEPSASSRSTAPEPSSDAAARDDVFYLYNVGSQAAETDGFFTNVNISKPELSRKDYHTLGELALQSADGKQIVEIGWSVDRVVNGDDDPHLFVYHWVDRQTTCYNGCGFVQYSKTVIPGDTLTVDTQKKFGIQYFNGAWWVAYDSEWVGYFPELLWNEQGVKFSKSGLIQVFGEVASTSEDTCTDMGNGRRADVDKSTSSFMSKVQYINGPDVAMFMRSTTKAYPLTILNSNTFRYGGPGNGTCPTE